MRLYPKFCKIILLYCDGFADKLKGHSLYQQILLKGSYGTTSLNSKSRRIDDLRDSLFKGGRLPCSQGSGVRNISDVLFRFFKD
jgi:hypothetical protein